MVSADRHTRRTGASYPAMSFWEAERFGTSGRQSLGLSRARLSGTTFRAGVLLKS